MPCRAAPCRAALAVLRLNAEEEFAGFTSSQRTLSSGRTFLISSKGTVIRRNVVETEDGPHTGFKLLYYNVLNDTVSVFSHFGLDFFFFLLSSERTAVFPGAVLKPSGTQHVVQK